MGSRGIKEGTLAGTALLTSAQPAAPAPEQPRSSSRSRRRLTASSLVGGLLGKRSETSTSTSSAAGGSSTSTDSTPRRDSFSSRRGSVDASASTSDADLSPEPSSSRSKPPVSLSTFLRRRRSSSTNTSAAEAPPPFSSASPRSSLDDGARRPPFGVVSGWRGVSNEGSVESSRMPLGEVVRGQRTDSAETTSSHDAVGSSTGRRSPPSAVTSQSSCSRRGSQGSILSEGDIARSPEQEEQEDSLSSGSDLGEEEDIRDFVRASGGGSTATPASPFSTHSRFSALSDPRSEESTPLDSPSSEESSHPSSTAPLQSRRLTSTSLTIPDFPRPDSPSTTLVPLPSTTIGSSVTSRARAGTSSSFTERRMRSLPRLLSNDAYNFAALRHPPTPAAEAPVEEADELETGESETETEDDGEAESTADTTVPSTEATAPVLVPAASSPFARPILSVVPPSWVTFDPVTPTPGPLRTARISSSVAAPSDSYFDIPRSSTTLSHTPGAPPMTPLLPQSLSNVARGKRPVHQDELNRIATPAAITPGRLSVVIPTAEASATAGEGAELGSAAYRRRANSAVAILSPSLLDRDEEPLGTAAIADLDPVWQTAGLRTPGPSFLMSPSLPPASPVQTMKEPASPTVKSSTGNKRLHRPRSMYELHVAPPAYHAVYTRSGLGPKQIVFPREEEGKEGLPGYTCAIHIEGYMPRKMEFTAPSIQAKDRAWKRQYVVLHGTSIKIYKYDLKTHPIAGEEDWATASTDMAGNDGPPPLHFHAGEYGGEPAPTAHKFPTSITDVRAKAKSKIVQAANSSDNNVLLRHYSLQNAESGLAADYIKRKHVVRVRAEGEQFLLQTTGDRGTIDLIEVLQAATNVALDLDARPLPKFITLPRRRRRRRRPETAADGTPAANAAGGSNPTSATASQAGAEEPDRMGDMLAEEQTAYSAQPGGASTV